VLLNVQAQAKTADFISRLPPTAEKACTLILGLFCGKNLLFLSSIVKKACCCGAAALWQQWKQHQSPAPRNDTARILSVYFENLCLHPRQETH